MGGFGTIVGFMFSFFVIIGVFIASFYVFQDRVVAQAQLDQLATSQLDTQLNLDLSLSKPFDYTSKVGFKVNVLGKKDFIFKNDVGSFCLDIFVNGNKYVSKKDYFIAPFYDISKNYNLIKSGKSGILFLYNYNVSQIKSLKIVSCGGKVFNFNYESNQTNWWNNNWNLRKNILVNNNYNSNLNEYQVEVNLNSSNFDFSKSSENSIRFVLPLKEDLIEDMGFDFNSQIQKDNSKYNNFGFLGTDSSTETKDPTFVERNCVLDNCLSFDGNDDLIRIPGSNSLLINNQVSVFSWVKWRGNGKSIQNIFTNGAWFNAIRIVNDGSSNQNKILFQLNIGGTTRYLYSNSTIDTNWHFIGGVYDGHNMKIYIDGKLDSKSINYDDLIVTNLGDNVLGAESDGNYNFNGTLDEFKLFDIALKDSEVKDLYYNYIGSRVLDYDIVNFDSVNKKSKVFVKVIRLLNNSNINLNLYYDYSSSNILNSASSIVNTFSYFYPRKIGYVLSDRIASTTGISLMSMEDNNQIKIGSNNFSLNNLGTATISKNNLSLYDSVSMTNLSQVEGNGDAVDIITPVSFAGTQFYYRGFRRSGSFDTFCIIPLESSSFVEIRDNTNLKYNGTIDNLGSCVALDIGTNDNLAINSTTPILVSYHGGSNQDAFVFYPATNDDLYGIPSSAGLMANGDNTNDVTVFRSDGSSQIYNLASFGTASFSSGGSSGSVLGHKLVSSSNGLLGAIQQADHDGTESTVFQPEKAFSTKFGSALANEYVTLVSNHPDANCSIYNGSNTLISNIANGVGSNGVYKYDFGVGNDNTYIAGKWYVQCDKPVMGYFEEDIHGDETNMLGYRQMRQEVYPSPSFVIN